MYPFLKIDFLLITLSFFISSGSWNDIFDVRDAVTQFLAKFSKSTGNTWNWTERWKQLKYEHIRIPKMIWDTA